MLAPAVEREACHARKTVETRVANAALDSEAPAFEIFPVQVNLKFQRDRQGLVVRFREPSGVHRDVTRQAIFTIADPTTAKVENGVVTPLADGETKVPTADDRSRRTPASSVGPSARPNVASANAASRRSE